jgi:hypothetical protein
MTAGALLAELAVRLVLAALVAAVVWAVDGPLLGVELVWWVCALIGLAVVFAVSVVIVVVSECD